MVASTEPVYAPAMSDEKDTTAKDELFEAIDHFKAAAGKLFDKAAASKTLKSVGDKVDEVASKIDKSTAAKKVEDLAGKLDPALETAGKEAERVISKIGASAEPLAKQLSSELGKLTQKITESISDVGKKDSEEE